MERGIDRFDYEKAYPKPWHKTLTITLINSKTLILTLTLTLFPTLSPSIILYDLTLTLVLTKERKIVIIYYLAGFLVNLLF